MSLHEGAPESSGRRSRSLDFQDAAGTTELSPEEAKAILKGQAAADNPVSAQMSPRVEKAPPRPRGNAPPDMELMKEKFAKLLLGEDMSGAGTGVTSALALSNAVTNLAASVWGEQNRLEPMPLKRKARWRKEIDWLLSVTDYIVEFVPSQQTTGDGRNMEIMITQQRKDLRINIPALKKLDAMLIEYLDNFKDQREFWYVSRDAAAAAAAASAADDNESEKRVDKWWLPKVRVPPNGLSDECRRWIQHQKELVNQVLKAAQAINANVLMEMEIPDDYIENLPKNGRSSLGESLYRNITDEGFDAEAFLETIDLSSEHKIIDVKDRIEASVVIWKRKMSKDIKSSWSVSTVSTLTSVSWEKREQFEDRAETILLILKHRFPGTAQSQLDISKIQYNKNVGFALLESYSRVLESLAYNVISKIEDVLTADALAQPSSTTTDHGTPKKKKHSSATEPAAASEETFKVDKGASNDLMTLSDFMDWHLDHDSLDKEEGYSDEKPAATTKKQHAVGANKRFSYIEKLVPWEI